MPLLLLFRKKSRWFNSHLRKAENIFFMYLLQKKCRASHGIFLLRKGRAHSEQLQKAAQLCAAFSLLKRLPALDSAVERNLVGVFDIAADRNAVGKAADLYAIGFQ